MPRIPLFSPDYQNGKSWRLCTSRAAARRAASFQHVPKTILARLFETNRHHNEKHATIAWGIIGQAVSSDTNVRVHDFDEFATSPPAKVGEQEAKGCKRGRVLYSLYSFSISSAGFVCCFITSASFAPPICTRRHPAASHVHIRILRQRDPHPVYSITDISDLVLRFGCGQRGYKAGGSGFPENPSALPSPSMPAGWQAPLKKGDDQPARGLIDPTPHAPFCRFRWRGRHR